jgi:hypothetical protein
MPKVMDRSRDFQHMRSELVACETRGMTNTITNAVRYSFQLLILTVVIAGAGGTVLSGLRPASAQAPQGGPDIVAALKATPGVLGVEAARTQAGKQALFVWFENKQAAVRWFYSDAHQELMRRFTPGASTGRKPLADVPDNTGPILAIASLTYADQPQVAGVQMPVSQIAVELYAPLPGGIAVGGRFAPSSVKVPGLIEVDRASR